MQLSSPVARAAAIVAAEAVGLLVLAGAYAAAGVTGEAASVAGSEVGALLVAAAGVVLLAVARGVLHRRRWSRAPAVVVQLLLALTAVSLLQTLPVVAVTGIALAVLVLAQLSTPRARREFAPEAADE